MGNLSKPHSLPDVGKLAAIICKVYFCTSNDSKVTLAHQNKSLRAATDINYKIKIIPRAFIFIAHNGVNKAN